MKEARAVIARLDRIEALERERAPARVVLAEVRALFAEAEAWVRAEPRAAADAAELLERCRAALERPRKTHWTRAGLW